MQNNTFLGHSLRQKIIVVDEISSTNDYLRDHASNFTPRDEFTAIMAINQTAGRGQRDNSFLSKPGESLTFSFILFPSFLAIADIFFINIIVSLGIQDWLHQHTPDSAIKWPNDIIVGNKKAGGVLIENKLSPSGIKNSIVGIGINVLQTSFPPEIEQKATSLLLQTDSLADLSNKDICCAILTQTCLRYQQLKAIKDKNQLLEEYNSNLYRKGYDTLFIIHGRQVNGRISHVDKNGVIYIDHDGVRTGYYLKEVSMVL